MVWQISGKRIRLKQLALFAVMALAMIATALVVDNPKNQGGRWTVPYFSGAANYRIGHGWRYNPADVERFNDLPSLAAQQAHRFEPSPESELVEFTYSPPGYLYVAVVARYLFFWQSDLQSVESLQLLTHIGITFWILGRFRNAAGRIVFFLLYGMNPVVLYCTMTPYYYFWAVIPTAMLCGYLLDKELRFGFWLPLAAAAAGWAYATRPTCLFVALLFFVYGVLREWKPWGLTAIAVFVVSALLFGGGGFQQRPWHTMYIGVAAYPNPYMDEFSDNKGYELFYQKTGKHLTGDRMFDRQLYDEYSALMKAEFVKIARERPLMLARNAFINYLLSFSIGYIDGSLKLTYASAAAGACFLALLLWQRKFTFILATTLCVISMFPYFPPVPAYMFGSYIILVAAFADIVSDWSASGRWFSARFDGSGAVL